MGRYACIAHTADGGHECIVFHYHRGAMIQTVGLPMIGVEGSVDFQSINVVSVLGAIAVFLASINILVASL